MDLLYHGGNFFRVLSKTHNGYRIQRLNGIIIPINSWRVQIQPMVDVTNGRPFVITKTEFAKYEPYDPEHKYIIGWW